MNEIVTKEINFEITKLEKVNTEVPIENKKYTDYKETINLNIEFKSKLEPDTKLSEVREELYKSIDKFLFKDYNKKEILKANENTITLRDILLKPRNKNQIEKYSSKTKIFNKNSYSFKVFPMEAIPTDYIDNRIGEGGFGYVYLTKYKSLGIVLKKMKNYNLKELMQEALVTHYFRSLRSLCVMGLAAEAKTASKTKDQKDKKNYELSMVLEHLNGEKFKDFLKRMNSETIKEPRNELIMILYALDLAKGINFLAKRNIIHRDLKPDNCITNKNMDLFIIDFGITKQQRTEKENTMTAEKGTGVYFPPENTKDTDEKVKDQFKTQYKPVVKQRKISSAFDVWCFGLIISEMFGCEPPWGANINAAQVVINHTKKKPFPIPTEISNDIIKLLIAFCTKYHPEERINTDEIITILVTLLQERIIYHSKQLNGISNVFTSYTEKLRFANKVKLIFESVDQSNTRLDNGYINFGNLLLQQGNIKKAEEYFEKALKYINENKLSNYNIYNCYGKLNTIKSNFVDAKRYYEMALELNPKNEVSYNNLASLYLDLGIIDKSYTYLLLAKQLNSKNSMTNLILGRINQKLRKFGEAERCYLRAKEYDPKNTEAYIRLAYLYDFKDLKVEAYKVYKDLSKLDSHNEKSYILIANHIYNISKRKNPKYADKIIEIIMKEKIEEREKIKQEKKMQNIKDEDMYDDVIDVDLIKEVRDLYNEARGLKDESNDLYETIFGYLQEVDDPSLIEAYYKEALQLNKQNLYVINEHIIANTNRAKTKSDKDKKKFLDQVGLLEVHYQHMGVKKEDLEKYKGEDLLKNRYDIHEESESILRKALKIDPNYKEGYVYLAKIFRLQNRPCEEEMITLKYNADSTDEEIIKFKKEVRSVSIGYSNAKMIEDEYRQAFTSEVSLKAYLEKELRFKTEFYSLDDSTDSIRLINDIYSDSVRSCWKLGLLRNEEVIIKFINCNMSNFKDKANSFLNYLEIMKYLNKPLEIKTDKPISEKQNMDNSTTNENKLTEENKIIEGNQSSLVIEDVYKPELPEFYGICYKEYSQNDDEDIINNNDKEPKTYSFGIIMKHLEGISLRNYMTKKETPLEKLKILIEVTKIIEYLHSRNIVSRGITPDSFIVNPKTGVIHLIEFDFSSIDLKTSDSVDIAMMRYNAPEAFIQKSESSISELYYEVTPKVDIWSIGTMMIEFFTNKVPFEGIKNNNAAKLLLLLMEHKEVLYPDSIRVEYPEIFSIIKKCLDYDYNNRITVTDLLGFLNKVHETYTNRMQIMD